MGAKCSSVSRHFCSSRATAGPKQEGSTSRSRTLAPYGPRSWFSNSRTRASSGCLPALSPESTTTESPPWSWSHSAPRRASSTGRHRSGLGGDTGQSGPIVRAISSMPPFELGPDQGNKRRTGGWRECAQPPTLRDSGTLPGPEGRNHHPVDLG